MESQNARVLAHMRISPIDPMQALKYAGVMRLGARIFELREAGHKIEDVMVEVKNRRGEKCWVKRYRLLKEAKNENRHR